MDALTFLAENSAAGPLYVLAGDEAFLKRQVIGAIKSRALGDDRDDQVVTTLAGETATLAAVYDELETIPFFSKRRVVIVDNADPFVTAHRSALEKKIGALPPTGVLVLDVKSWTSTTRLAKMVPDEATILCKAPSPYSLAKWSSDWARTRYGKQLPSQAASLLVELAGSEMGLLDQELLKLSIYVGNRKTIDAADVDRAVGNNRAESTFKIFDAIAEGNSAMALAILERQFEQGEEPMRMAGAFGYQLRKLARVAYLVRRKMPIPGAMQAAGVHPNGRKGAEQQLRYWGRARILKLYDWLVQLNMELRGDSPLSPKVLLERFVVRLARPQSAAKAMRK